MPHFRSRLMHRGFKPSRNHDDVIWTAFGDQTPAGKEKGELEEERRRFGGQRLCHTHYTYLSVWSLGTNQTLSSPAEGHGEHTTKVILNSKHSTVAAWSYQDLMKTTKGYICKEHLLSC